MGWYENLDWSECIYCGSHRLIEKEHLQAFVRGGVTEYPACRGCNRRKSHNPLTKWLERIASSKIRKDQCRWERIIDYHYGKSNPIAQRVHSVQRRIN